MMKIFAICLAAFIAVASAQDEFPGEDESQLSLMTTDDAEVAGLSGDNQVFNDFCISSRDHVFNDIKSNSNQLSSRIFGLFFDSAENLGRDVLEVSKNSAARLSGQLANPDAAIAAASNDAEQIIAQGQQNIQNVQTQPLALIEAFKTTVKAISQTVGSQFSQKVENLKKLADVSTLASSIQTACAAIERYENENLESFEKAKAELVEANPALASVTFDQVPCTTTRRISRLDGLCKFAAASKAPLQKMAATFMSARQQQ